MIGNDSDSKVEDYVLDAVADGYESWQSILASVRQFAKNGSITVRRSEVLKALQSLVNKGLVQSYLLRPVHVDWATAVDWDLNRLHELWYYITPAGLARIKELKADS
jgi:hypothetical protein